MLPTAHHCTALTREGRPCQATPLRDADFCIYHSPEHTELLQEARRLGGLRRRKEATIGTAFEVEGVDTVPRVRRILEVAVTDTLELPNSVARNRTLGLLAQVALRLMEQELQDTRIRVLEASVLPRPRAG